MGKKPKKPSVTEAKQAPSCCCCGGQAAAPTPAPAEAAGKPDAAAGPNPPARP